MRSNVNFFTMCALVIVVFVVVVVESYTLYCAHFHYCTRCALFVRCCVRRLRMYKNQFAHLLTDLATTAAAFLKHIIVGRAFVDRLRRLIACRVRNALAELMHVQITKSHRMHLISGDFSRSRSTDEYILRSQGRPFLSFTNKTKIALLTHP